MTLKQMLEQNNVNIVTDCTVVVFTGDTISSIEGLVLFEDKFKTMQLKHSNEFIFSPEKRDNESHTIKVNIRKA